MYFGGPPGTLSAPDKTALVVVLPDFAPLLTAYNILESAMHDLQFNGPDYYARIDYMAVQDLQDVGALTDTILKSLLAVGYEVVYAVQQSYKNSYFRQSGYLEYLINNASDYFDKAERMFMSGYASNTLDDRATLWNYGALLTQTITTFLTRGWIDIFRLRALLVSGLIDVRALVVYLNSTGLVVSERLINGLANNSIDVFHMFPTWPLHDKKPESAKQYIFPGVLAGVAHVWNTYGIIVNLRQSDWNPDRANDTGPYDVANPSEFDECGSDDSSLLSVMGQMADMLVSSRNG